MLDWFIRSTKLYRDLESLARESSIARVVSEDRSRLLEEYLSEARTLLAEAHSQTLEAHKMLENILWEQKYGSKLYPEAGPDLPAADVDEPQPLQAPGIQARSLVRRQRKQFFDTLVRPH